MKAMKNLLKTAFVVFLLFGIVSCNGPFTQKDTSSGKTTLKINVQDTELARSVSPSTNVGILSNFVISGKKSDASNPNAPTNQLATAENLTKLGETIIEFDDSDAGTWFITLSANYTIGEGTNSQTLPFSETKTVTIQKNILNSVSFALKNTSFEYGGVSITIDFKDENNSVKQVVASLETKDREDGYEEKIFGTTDFTTTETQGVKRIVYTRDITVPGELSTSGAYLPSGTYFLGFTFLDAEDNDLNFLPMQVHVVNGLTSTASFNLELNQVYAIKYHYFVGDAELAVLDGYTLPTGVEIKDAAVLPGSYSTKQKMNLPELVKEGCIFEGWYDSNSWSNKISFVGWNGANTEKHVYAKFLNTEITVAESGGQFNSISSAIEYINTLNKANADWTIKVSGLINETVPVNEIIGTSLTLKGVNTESGLTGGETEKAIPLLKVDFPEPANYDDPRIPVILKNFKLISNENTGNGGGLYVGSYSEVILDDGAVISNNTAANGGGVYVEENGTVRMNSGAYIQSNIATTGKGVYLESYGQIYMGGTAVITSDNDIYIKEGAGITLGSTLTGTSPQATITPESYKVDFRVLYSDWEQPNGPKPEDEYESFAITQPQGSTKTWKVRSDGKITCYDFASDSHDYVDFDLPSGTLWSTINYGQGSNTAGCNINWNTFDYGSKVAHGSDPAWSEEWSIASTAEWQELISECYWMTSGTLRFGSGQTYKAYYVFKAKDSSHKGIVNTYNTSYSIETDEYIMIINYNNGACYYWPQIFVDATWLNKAASSYTPKPPYIDFSNDTQPKVNNTWASSPSKTLCRLVISKKRTLVVTSDGDDNHSGRNASTSGQNEQPLKTIQGAINKIKAVGNPYIDWNIVVFGELTGAQTISNITKNDAKSITLYGGNGLDESNEPRDTLNGGFTESTPGTTLTIDTDVSVTIKNLKITGGYTAGDSINDNGAGISIQDANYDEEIRYLTIEAGTLITGNNSTSTAAGIGITYGTKALITMNGGSIENNTCDCNMMGNFGGAGVLLSGDDSNRFIMNGGTIRKNTSSGYGGGVCITYGAFEMHEGAVIGGTTADDGNICTGSAVAYGGGVCVKGGTFTMDGGIISHNVSTSTSELGGGGVCVYGTFNMTGGTISSNTTSYKGSGVCVYKNTTSYTPIFTMGNEATIAADNDVYLRTNKTITITSAFDSTITHAATITPESYGNTTVLDGDYVATEYDKFTVTPQGSKTWTINEEGKLSESSSVNDPYTNSSNYMIITGGTIGQVTGGGSQENEGEYPNIIIPSLYVGNSLVSQSEYEKYMTYYSTNVPTETGSEKDTTPVYYVSWIDAVIYCNLRSMTENKTPVYSISGETDPTSSTWQNYNVSSITKDGKNLYYYNSDQNAYAWDTDSSFNFNLDANGYRLMTSAECRYICENYPALFNGSTMDEWTQTFSYEPEAYRMYYSSSDGTCVEKTKGNASREQNLGFRIVHNIP